MKRLSDINTCNLQGYCNCIKKDYSGLVGNWIYNIEFYNPYTNYKIESWEFGWKQKALKESFKIDYNNYKKSLYKQYLIDDYNTCFITFRLVVYTLNTNITRTQLYLHSTDDSSFYMDFDYIHIDKVKKYFKNNYKTLTLDKIEQFINKL